jgi:hypothetical protein
MIHPEKGNHANHPGHANSDCPLRQQVNAALYGTSSNGYGCSWTGGHCVKSEACADRVQQHEAEAPQREMVAQYMTEKEMFRQHLGWP